VRRPVDKLLDDIVQAAEVADEIVRRGRAGFGSDPVAQFGPEAVVGRIGDAAWNTPCDDVPMLRAAIERYRGRA
jgi:hypothetical protein